VKPNSCQDQSDIRWKPNPFTGFGFFFSRALGNGAVRLPYTFGKGKVLSGAKIHGPIARTSDSAEARVARPHWDSGNRTHGDFGERGLVEILPGLPIIA